MNAGSKFSAPGIISLSGIIIADKIFSSSIIPSIESKYFLKNFTFFLLWIFLAELFKYFFGISFLSLTLKKQGFKVKSYVLREKNKITFKSFLPDSRTISANNSSIYEYIGIIYYFIRGYI